MSRRLFLLRHTEAAFAASDRVRPLTTKGRQDAAIMAEKMYEFKMIPDYIMCSPAKRTCETCDILMETLPGVSTIFPEYLYEATTEEIFAAIKTAPDSCKSILIIGHNPAIQSLTTFLIQKGDRKALNVSSYGYKPGTLSTIDCNTDLWADIKPEDNKLNKVLITV